MVEEARQRADESEERLSAALERAETVRQEADAHANRVLTNARTNADEIVTEAREHAETIISEAVNDSERERSMAQREVEELNRQRESITGYLDDLRSLLGADPVSNLAAAAQLQQEHDGAPPAEQSDTAPDHGIADDNDAPWQPQGDGDDTGSIPSDNDAVPTEDDER
jgi:cell division septum initiation protein DivIVA